MQELRSLLKSETAFETLGVTALERGDAAGAAAHFRKGLEVAPGSASLHQRLGTALLLTGDAAGGRKALEAALQIDPRFARAHYSLAVLMLSSGQYQPAIDRLATAIEADPQYLEARLLRADLLRSGGRAAEALRAYGEVLAIDAQVREAVLGEVLSRVLLGQYRQARDRVSAALTAHPGEPAYVEALVRLLAAAPDGAVRDGRQALALAQEFGAARTPEQSEAMAMAYAETGDFTRAVAEQRAAIAAADHAGRAPHIRAQMRENLRLFERGQACREPWREGTMP
jgi:tetratricopeptide (TPR) repeat protein